MYTAVVLDDLSQHRLFTDIVNANLLVTEGWEWLGHHVTVNMGGHACGPMIDVPLGTKLGFMVEALGGNEKVAAVKVMPLDTKKFKSNNATPHVTLAVHRERGGKPMMSNEITKWSTTLQFVIEGTLEEVS